MPIPFVTFIIPVGRSLKGLQDSVSSVLTQTVPCWELLCVGVPSGTAGLDDWLLVSAEGDPRIKLIPADGEMGPGAVKNTALRNAAGRMVTVLEPGWQLYGDYAGQLRRLGEGADVIIFSFDLRCHRGEGFTWSDSWDSVAYSNQLFMKRPPASLGTAFRRSVAQLAGNYNETLWRREDWDLLKRLARRGCAFRFLPIRCGVLDVRDESSSEMALPTSAQRASIEKRFSAGEAIFGAPLFPSRHTVANILYASPDAFIDPWNPAAIRAGDALKLLSGCGFNCRVFCGSKLVREEQGAIGEFLLSLRYPHRTICLPNHDGCRLIYTMKENTNILIFDEQHDGAYSSAALRSFANLFANYLDVTRPDCVVAHTWEETEPLYEIILRLSKRRDIPLVFGFQSPAAKYPWALRDIDYCVVGTDSARRRYWKQYGVACSALPLAVDWSRVRATRRDPRYVLLVNPSPSRGLNFAARIAEQVYLRRPDIPFLFVEAAGRPWRDTCSLDLTSVANIKTLAPTRDPRDFYSVARVLLAPALADAQHEQAATEALINGIPVLAANRCPLPELVRDAGITFDGPASPGDCEQKAPSPEAVAPWVDAIVRMYHDRGAYEALSSRALELALRWEPLGVAAAYTRFFHSVVPQPAPPIVPRLVETAPHLRARGDTGGQLAADDRSPPCPGRLGKYRLARQLGCGTMGTVYEAIEEPRGRRVALKLMAPELCGDEFYRDAFRREALAMSRLRHPSLVPVFEAGENGGRLFYTMKLIEGAAADDVIGELRRVRRGYAEGEVSQVRGDQHTARAIAWRLLNERIGPGRSQGRASARHWPARARSLQLAEIPASLYFRNITLLGLRLASALAFVHRRCVLHRDVKPANIILDEECAAWLADFGVLAVGHRDDERVGTRKYAAPEQYNLGRCDERSDVYGLGMSLYDFITTDPDDRGLLRDLEPIVLRAIAYVPEDRYQSMDAMVQDLQRILKRLDVQVKNG